MISELRPYQVEALANIRDSVRGGVRRLVVQAATGAGKTKLAAAIVEGARGKNSRVAFCVPAIALVDQTVESFYAEGIRDIGVIQANHEMTDWSRPVQVCSIQTIRRRGFPEANVVMFDEIHQLHEAHKTWLTHPDWQNVPMIGLSATPWTKGLGKYFNSLLIAATTSDLIDQGYLSPFRVFATGHPDLSDVKTVAGDYHEGQLSDAMQKGELTADIIRTWQQKWNQGKTLCFGVDKAHAKSIQERFEHVGISCGYQDADTSADERREIKAKFHDGRYQVVSNIQTLCLDEKTEILTASGWVGIEDMNYSHLIAAWAEDRIEFTPPKFIVKRDRQPNERMVSVNGRMQNIRVTSNHRMLWSKTKKNFEIVSAESIVGKVGNIPVSGFAPPRSFSFPKIEESVYHRRHISLTHSLRKKGKSRQEAEDLAVAHREHIETNCQPKVPSALSLDECRFIGFWLGDGTRSGGRFTISQSKRYPAIIAWCSNLLERLGLHHTVMIYPPAAKSTFESVRWCFSTGRGGGDQARIGGLSPLMPYLEKNGTDLFWGLDREQFSALLEGYWMADGNHGDGVTKKERGWRIFGRNKPLFDLLQAVGECRGYRISLTVDKSKHRKTPFYRITWVDRTAVLLLREKFSLENDFKPERVWCVTSTTGNLITRREGKVAVVGNTTGVDWDVRCLILARPTRSEMLYVQIIGRALRTADGKDYAMILDHSDTTAKLGFVTDIHHEHLDDGKPPTKAEAKEKKEPLPKECSECAYLKPPKTKICPNCGHESKVRSDIMEADGELVEWTPGKRAKAKSRHEYTESEQRQFYAQLKAHGIAKGYSSGWAYHKFFEKFKAKPPYSFKSDPPAAEISPEVVMWIRSRQIAWAKSKRNTGSSADAQ